MLSTYYVDDNHNRRLSLGCAYDDDDAVDRIDKLADGELLVDRGLSALLHRTGYLINHDSQTDQQGISDRPLHPSYVYGDLLCRYI